MNKNLKEALSGIETLLPLSEYIEKIDSEYPKTLLSHEMSDLVFDKYKMICTYTRFLKQKLTIDMFEEDNKIFEGGYYVDLQPSTNYNYYIIAGKKIFMDGNSMEGFKALMSLGMTVADIAGKNIKIIK